MDVPTRCDRVRGIAQLAHSLGVSTEKTTAMRQPSVEGAPGSRKHRLLTWRSCLARTTAPEAIILGDASGLISLSGPRRPLEGNSLKYNKLFYHNFLP